jgi:hypothetical protein
VIITRISTTKNRWNFRLLQQVLHFEQRIARQRECSLEKEKGKSARDPAGKIKIGHPGK